jgi:hypothetical protein
MAESTIVEICEPKNGTSDRQPKSKGLIINHDRRKTFHFHMRMQDRRSSIFSDRIHQYQYHEADTRYRGVKPAWLQRDEAVIWLQRDEAVPTNGTFQNKHIPRSYRLIETGSSGARAISGERGAWTMNTAPSLKAAMSQSKSKMISLQRVVEEQNRIGHDEDCGFYKSTRSIESGTSRTASLTDEDASTWETHSNGSSFTTPVHEMTADAARESQLQAQFAEQTAKEMAQLMIYWSGYDSNRTPKTQAHDGDHQRTCLPTNSLILDHNEVGGEACVGIDTVSSTPWSAMSHMSAMTPRTLGFGMTPQHFNFLDEDSTPPVPHSPTILDEPFSLTTSLSVEKLHWIVREQKSRVDEICRSTQTMADSLAELADTSGDADEDDFDHCELLVVASELQKLPLPPLPELAWREQFALQLKGNTQRLEDCIFLFLLHLLPMECLSAGMWLKSNTSARTRVRLAWLVYTLLAVSFLSLGPTTYSSPISSVYSDRLSALDPYHGYSTDTSAILYSTAVMSEHEHYFLL